MNNLTMDKLLVLISLIICIISCNNPKTEEKSASPPEGWKELIENDFSIIYPNDWSFNESGHGGTVFGIISKHTSPEDQFSENVNLIIQDLTNLNYNLDKFTEISEEQIRKMVANSVILDSKRQYANSLEFQKVLYTGDFEQFNLTIEQYYWIRNNQAYVLTLTCQTAAFESYKEIGEKILNSFTFK